MARAATTSTTKSYAVEIFGPLVSGTYNGRVTCNGETIGWTGEYGRHVGVEREAVTWCERHEAGGTVVELDLAAVRREAAEADTLRKALRKPPDVKPYTAEEVAEMNRQQAEASARNWERNEEKKAKGYQRIFKEIAETARRGKKRVPA